MSLEHVNRWLRFQNFMVCVWFDTCSKTYINVKHMSILRIHTTKSKFAFRRQSRSSSNNKIHNEQTSQLMVWYATTSNNIHCKLYSFQITKKNNSFYYASCATLCETQNDKIRARNIKHERTLFDFLLCSKLRETQDDKICARKQRTKAYHLTMHLARNRYNSQYISTNRKTLQEFSIFLKKSK